MTLPPPLPRDPFPPPMPQPPAPQRSSLQQIRAIAKWSIAGLFIAAVAGVVVQSVQQQDMPAAQPSPQAAAYAACTALLMQGLHDPGSFEPVQDATSAAYKQQGDTLTVRLDYRAKNKFGALVLNSATCRINTKTGKIKINT